jgi:hypothetical protein
VTGARGRGRGIRGYPVSPSDDANDPTRSGGRLTVTGELVESLPPGARDGQGEVVEAGGRIGVGRVPVGRCLTVAEVP